MTEQAPVMAPVVYGLVVPGVPPQPLILTSVKPVLVVTVQLVVLP